MISQRSELRTHWEMEKGKIQKIRTMKSEIENLKQEADKFERDGDLGKVAEIRYGRIVNLEKQLKEETQKLAQAQQDKKMLKEEVDAEDIAEVVAKWTGIPVSKMLESERSKLLKLKMNFIKELLDRMKLFLQFQMLFVVHVPDCRMQTNLLALLFFLEQPVLVKQNLHVRLQKFFLMMSTQ